jgi:hypothetical protein
MPVILATPKAEIRRIVVPSQPGQIILKTLSQKYPTHKRAGGVTQVVGHLPSNCDALSSNPSTVKKKKMTHTKICSNTLQRNQNRILENVQITHEKARKGKLKPKIDRTNRK